MSEGYFPQGLDASCFQNQVTTLRAALGIKLRNGGLPGFGAEYGILCGHLEDLHGSLQDTPLTIESLKPMHEDFKRLKHLSGQMLQ